MSGMQTVTTDQGPNVRVGLVPVDKIMFHPHNTRTDLGDLRSLSLSIARYGMMQPVVIEKYGDQFRLRAGHRRVAAAKIANVYRIPAIIHPAPLGEQAWLEHAIQENVQRREMDVGDRLRAVKALRKLGCTWAGIADTFGVAETTVRSWTAPTVSLSAVPEDLQAPAGPRPAPQLSSGLQAARQEVARVSPVMSRKVLREFVACCEEQGYGNTDVLVLLQALIDGRPWRTLEEALLGA